MLLSRIFAQTLQCEAGGADACGVCTSCRQAEGKNHPDIIYVTHEKPALISVNEIRQQVVDVLESAGQGLSEEMRENMYQSLALISDNLKKI